MSDTVLPRPDPPAAPQPGPKRKRGGQPLNTNAAVHLAYAKRRVRDQRDRYRRRAERDGRGLLKMRGLVGNPLAREIVRNIVRLETMGARLGGHSDSRGFLRRDGSLQPAVSKEIEVRGALLSEYRRLFELLQPEAPSEVVVRVIRGEDADRGQEVVVRAPLPLPEEAADAADGPAFDEEDASSPAAPEAALPRRPDALEVNAVLAAQEAEQERARPDAVGAKEDEKVPSPAEMLGWTRL